MSILRCNKCGQEQTEWYNDQHGDPCSNYKPNCTGIMIKVMEEILEQPDYDFEPYCILEGGQGLSNTEEVFVDKCNYMHIKNWVLDNLYEDPEKIKAIKYLKPKTIILGTTGTYADKLNKIKEIFAKLNYFPNHVMFTMGEDYFYELMNLARIKNPIIKFYRIYPSAGKKYPILIKEIDD